MTNSELKSKLESSYEFLHNQLSQIRTGRVNANLLDSVVVKAYGSDLTIKEVGTVVVLDNSTLQIQIWDKGLIEAVAKSIRESDLGLNPVEKADCVLVPVPPLTEERRKEFSHNVTLKVEEAKKTIRHIRQEAMKDIEEDFEAKKFGEDEKFARREQVEELVKEYTRKIEELGARKKEDIMKV